MHSRNENIAQFRRSKEIADIPPFVFLIWFCSPLQEQSKRKGFLCQSFVCVSCSLHCFQTYRLKAASESVFHRKNNALLLITLLQSQTIIASGVTDSSEFCCRQKAIRNLKVFTEDPVIHGQWENLTAIGLSPAPPCQEWNGKWS